MFTLPNNNNFQMIDPHPQTSLKSQIFFYTFRLSSSTHRATQQWHMSRATHIALLEGWPKNVEYMFTDHSP